MMTSENIEGQDCIVFTIQGDWGYFGKIDRSVTKQTYDFPPRTTIAGLIAGILGREPNSYHDTFSKENSWVALSIESPVRKIDMTSLGLGVDSELQTVGSVRSGTRVKRIDQSGDSQIHPYQYLVKPKYTIFVSLSDGETLDELEERLDPNSDLTEPVFTPSMGLSELLCTVTYDGRYTIKDEDETEVQSIVPDSVDKTIPQGGVTYRTEKCPAYMEETKFNRRTTDFSPYTYNPSGGTIELTNSDDVYSVNNTNVVFE